MTVPELLPEPIFLRMLGIERKRAERSRRPFALMLISPRDGRLNGNGPYLVRKAAAAVIPAVRETDVAGWHSQDIAVGVIFVEFGSSEPTTTMAALRQKMTAALQGGVSRTEYAQLRVSFHCFPESWGDQEDRSQTIAELYPDLVRRRDARWISRAVKRTIDLIGSITGLLLLSPVMLAVAVGIKATSPGPVLFRQRRIGQHGVPFTFLKFRSMHAVNDPQIHRDYVTRLIAGDSGTRHCDSNGKVSFKLTHDPRVTRLGRLLRRTSLDELPQLLNVVMGTMSLVGPRPPIAYEVAAYDVWHRRRLLEMKPGITGLWQVSGRSSRSFDEMVRLDIRYAQRWSTGLDLRILLKTPGAVLSGDDAY
jgi:lipopolysaccharide/colanic/teichoic acid biosynthesis glycosyltransferase